MQAGTNLIQIEVVAGGGWFFVIEEAKMSLHPSGWR
jgi:hypothetical protein